MRALRTKTTAKLLNELFVSIKVDREERPDIDAIYMNAVQALNHGQGGWPMSVWLTPHLEPFYAGTYYPPRITMAGLLLADCCSLCLRPGATAKAKLPEQRGRLPSFCANRSSFRRPATPNYPWRH